MKRRLLKASLMLTLLVTYFYTCAITSIPQNIVIIEGEKLNLKMATGLSLISKNQDTVLTASNINKQKISEAGVEKLKLSLFGDIKIKDVNNDLTSAVKINVNGEGNITTPKIVGGSRYFVALKGNGTVWSWGLNSNGQLGVGDTTNRTEPTEVKAEIEEDGEVKEEEITDAVDIAVGYYHTLILRKDGTVWSAGYNHRGQLGDGTTTSTTLFHKVKGENGVGYLSNIVQIAAAGGGTSYALTADGSVYAWGYNYYGQFGTNTTSGESANVYPVKTQKVSNIIQITAQELSLMMLDADGSVWATGYNNYGGLGIGHSNDVSLPQQMLDTDRSVLYGVKEISGGRYHAVIMKEDNTVWGVGYNGYGQVGDGTTSNRTIISQAKNSAGEVITDAKHIMASGDGTYVTRQKTEDGKPQGMYAVGRNNYGQLFTKDTSTKYKVVEVEKDKT